MRIAVAELVFGAASGAFLTWMSLRQKIPKPAVVYYSLAKSDADEEVLYELDLIAQRCTLTLTVSAFILFIQALFLALCVGMIYGKPLFQQEEVLLQRRAEEESEEEEVKEEEEAKEEDKEEEPKEEKKDK